MPMISTEISPDVSALVERLKGVAPGDKIAYTDLSRVIGRDIKGVRWMLLRALHVANRDHGVVFANERGVGYVRLTTDKIPDVGATARARVRRVTRNAAKRIRSGTQFANDLPPEVQRRINAELSSLALIEHVSAERHVVPTRHHEERPEPVAVTARRMFGFHNEE